MILNLVVAMLALQIQHNRLGECSCVMGLFMLLNGCPIHSACVRLL